MLFYCCDKRVTLMIKVTMHLAAAVFLTSKLGSDLGLDFSPVYFNLKSNNSSTHAMLLYLTVKPVVNSETEAEEERIIEILRAR